MTVSIVNKASQFEVLENRGFDLRSSKNSNSWLCLRCWF